MNDFLQKTKKNSLVHKTGAHNTQKIGLIQAYAYCTGGPKNPPNISQYYHQMGHATKKKEGISRQAKLKENRQIIRERGQPELRNSHCGIEAQKTNSRLISTNGYQKINSSKKERKTDLKPRKNPKQLKQIHRIVRPHQKIKPKIYHNKQNKQPKSGLENREERSTNCHKMGQTQVFDKENQKYHLRRDALVCYQNIQVNEKVINKIKKRIKYLSHQIPSSNSFENLSQIYQHRANLLNKLRF